MEFISSEAGQSLQLIHMDEVRPLRGGAFLPDVVAEIVNRYRFQAVPPRPDPSQPLKFEVGVRELDGLTIPVSSLAIYSDGVLVVCRNTDDADAVLTDLLAWSYERFNGREPKTWLPRRYHSRIVVDFEQSAGDTFLHNFKELAAIVTRAFGSERDLELTELSFAPNPPGELPALYTWSFQPRAGQPPAPNRYFSAAPLATSAHVDMLGELEAAALRRRR